MSTNKTLNKADREALMEFANRNITCPDEKAALEAAYSAAKPLVLQTIHTRFPPADMAILERYGAARRDDCIRFGGSYDTDSTFYFNSGDPDVPLVPRQSGCGQLYYEWSREARDSLNAYVLARQKLEKARRSKMEDYRRLIVGSRMFNDVVEVWPAAEALRPKLIPKTKEQRALAVLSEEAIARIKADNAGAMKEAA